MCKNEGCEGWLKPGTIMFGEPLNPETVKKALDMMEECDLLIVVISKF
jgi:NAD-dependent SIR2 family protein deacetylase